MQRNGSDITIEGVVERIVFFNEENCYCVASLKPSKKGLGAVTITGVMPSLQCGETVSVCGEWSAHASYGAQIKVRSFETKLPSSLYGIEKYLGSGLVEGIGAGFAKKIVARFGEKTLEIIDTDSGRLREIKGLGANRIKRIKQSWDEQKELRGLLVDLRVYGIGIAMCVRIMRTFGVGATEIVRTQPYRLMREVDGIGFKTADMIALNLGIPNESRERIEAGILHVLGTVEEGGGTCAQFGAVVAEASRLLNVDSSKCAQALKDLSGQGEIKITGDGFVQSSAQDYAERRIARNLVRLTSSKSVLPPIKREIAAEWAMRRAGFAFAPEQTRAVIEALSHTVSVITGGPGTGKTTILRALCDILRAKKVAPVLAAPTGRAAQRMSESAHMEAKTVHRLLGYENGKFAHGEYKPLECEVLIVDEASMLDNKLASALISSVPSGAHLVLVGDIDQLPSVGAGNVLRDIIDSRRFPVTRLEHIFRQGDRSRIVVCAHNILNGDDSLSELSPCPLCDTDFSSDMNFVLAPTPEECISATEKLVGDLIPKKLGLDPVRDVQVLAPMHKGSAGIERLNAVLKGTLNPNSEGVVFGSSRFCAGDKIMQTRNNYDLDIFNGDMGIIESVGANSSITVNFDSRRVVLPRGALADCQSAYAISIHKSQGSEFPVVVIPLVRQHFVMLQRNLVYTALTRARRKAFIVGDPSAWSAAVANARSAARKTLLKERILGL